MSLNIIKKFGFEIIIFYIKNNDSLLKRKKLLNILIILILFFFKVFKNYQKTISLLYLI